MRRSLLVMPFACLALLLAPSTSGAALPSPANKSIQPGKSIGGVRIGGTLEAARQAWGDGGRCTSSSCSYRTDGDLNGAEGDAYFATDGRFDDKISLVRIAAPGVTRGKPVFRGPLVKLKTSKGIGLGSKLKTLRRKYPKVRRGSGSGTWVLRAGRRQTSFRVDGASKRVEYILVEALLP